MRNLIRIAFLALIALPAVAVAEPAMWGGDGHRMVCGVAWQRLTSDGRALATSLLGSNSQKTFVDACVWADSVRDDRPETYNYHFVNIPAGARGMDIDLCATPKRCAPWAIVHFGHILGNGSANRIARVEALKWVLHFVGDVHQPLHAGRPGDRGGNSIVVDFFGDRGTSERRNNLHSVWDAQMLRRANLRWPDGSNYLFRQIVPDEAKSWETLNVTDWANESFRINEDFVYNNLDADGRIRNAYYKPAIAIAETQIMKGGVRLAHLINSVAAGRAGGLTL